MSNVIDMREYREIDPILRKGDLVRVVEHAHLPGIGRSSGIVSEILETYGPDSDAPGQASWLTIAIPDEEGWCEYDVALDVIVRILGPEADELRGYRQDSM